MRLNRYELPIKDVEWDRPVKVEKEFHDTKRIALDCKTEKGNLRIYVTFPKNGGIRFYTEKPGFFTPPDLCDISFDGKTYTAENGMKMSVLSEKDGFTFAVSDETGNYAFNLKSSEMLIGYDNGEWIKAGLDLPLSEDESIYGFGERFDYTNQHSKHFTLWNQDCWSLENMAYKNMAIWQSNAGYMAFFNSSYSCEVDAGLEKKDRLTFEFEGPIWDLYIYLGEPLKRIKEYTGLTGCPTLPPEWSLRYWAGGAFQVWENWGQDRYLDVVKDCLDGYAKLGMHNIACLGGEGLPFHNADTYPVLKEHGTKMIAWHHPSAWVADMQKDLGTEDLFKIPYMRDPSDWTKQAYREVLDFSHPNAKNVVAKYFEPFWDWGVKGTMVDYGEILPLESATFDGHTGDEMHNMISYWYNKAYHDAWTERMGEDHILFSRSGYAGCQKWVGNFGGDQQGTFDGLNRAVRGMLNLTSCGFSVWGTDIGSYGGPPSNELFARWMQFGAFNVLMRAHGCGNDRNPWNYGEASTKTFVKLYWLRENILPTLSACCAKAHYVGIPATQMMQTAFPHDNFESNEGQYIFCDNFLVCPVLEEGAVTKEVKFPKGNWYDLFNGGLHKGGKTETVPAPLEDIPVFLKAGSVLKVTVAKDGWLCSPTENVECDSALLLTKPDSETVETIYGRDGSKKDYRLIPEADGFSLVLPEDDDTSVFMVCGAKVRTDSADGEQNGWGSKVRVTRTSNKVKFICD